MAVHILKHGVTFCGMAGLPVDWPPGHTWIAFYDPDVDTHVDCEACLAEKKRRAEQGQIDV